MNTKLNFSSNKASVFINPMTKNSQRIINRKEFKKSVMSGYFSYDEYLRTCKKNTKRQVLLFMENNRIMKNIRTFTKKIFFIDRLYNKPLASKKIAGDAFINTKQPSNQSEIRKSIIHGY